MSLHTWYELMTQTASGFSLESSTMDTFHTGAFEPAIDRTSNNPAYWCSAPVAATQLGTQFGRVEIVGYCVDRLGTV
eukprot:IDg6955t1